MASAHLFLDGGMMAYLLPRAGAFSVYREGIDRPAIATAIAKELAPAGKKTDWTGFYGFGGGFDILLSRHFGIRTQADLVYDHLFDDLLKDGRFTVRFSVGPCFNFGKNIK